jgi:hypothetical protein
MDLIAQEVLSVALTGNDEDDAAAGSRMLQAMLTGLKVLRAGNTTNLASRRFQAVRYSRLSYPASEECRCPASEKEDLLPAHPIQHNEAVRYIRQNGLPKWKEVQGCHHRSLNETVMFRYKTIFGGNPNPQLS